MKTTLSAAVIFGVALLCSGCASGTSLWSHGAVRSGQFFGDAGISGNNNVVTIQKWSRMNKLSIYGDNNEVTLENRVRVPLIEVWGSGNTVSIPYDMIVQFNQAGRNNRLVERVSRPLDGPIGFEPEPVVMPEPVTVREIEPMPMESAEPTTITPVYTPPAPEPEPLYEPMEETPATEQTPAPSGVIIRDVDPANK